MSNIVSNQFVSKRDKEVNFKNVGGSNVQRGMGTDINYDMPFSKEIVITKINAISFD